MFREEYLLRLGPNRGQEIFERMKVREEEFEITRMSNEAMFITKKVIQDSLDNYPNIYGPLDAASY